jgi:hypothetical protein
MDATKPRLSGQEALLGELLGDTGRVIVRLDEARAGAEAAAVRLENAAGQLASILVKITTFADRAAADRLKAADLAGGAGSSAGQQLGEIEQRLADAIRSALAGLGVDQLRQELRGLNNPPSPQPVRPWYRLAELVGAAIVGGLVVSFAVKLFG